MLLMKKLNKKLLRKLLADLILYLIRLYSTDVGVMGLSWVDC
jgi:hypothetical protein